MTTLLLILAAISCDPSCQHYVDECGLVEGTHDPFYLMPTEPEGATRIWYRYVGEDDSASPWTLDGWRSYGPWAVISDPTAWTAGVHVVENINPASGLLVELMVCNSFTDDEGEPQYSHPADPEPNGCNDPVRLCWP